MNRSAALVVLLLAQLVTAQLPGANDLGRLDALAAEGRWDEVVDGAEQALAAGATGPDARWAHYWLGRGSHALGLALSTGDAFSRDLGRSLMVRAVEQLGTVVAAGPDPAAAASGAVSIEEAQEWWFRARLDVGEEAELLPDLNRAWEQDGLADAAYVLGLLAERGLPEPAAGGPVDRAALRWFGAASEARPERGDYALAWALALARQGAREQAAQVWEGACGGDASLSELLGTLLQILPGAEHAAERLLRLDRLARRADAVGDGTLSWHRAYALDQEGRSEEAEVAFASVTVGRSPALDRAHALLLVRLGRHGEAVDLLAVRAADRDWDAYDQLVGVADLLAIARRADEALVIYDRALAIEHRNERARRNRALTLWRSGRHDESLEAWRGVLDLLPGRGDILNDAALAAGAAGEVETARQWFEQAVALPGSQDAQENLAAWILAHDPSRTTDAVALLDAVLSVEPDRARALYLRHRALRRP